MNTPNPNPSPELREGEFLPCPFCGSGDPIFVQGSDDDGNWVAVVCPDCGVGSRQHYHVMEDAHPHAQNAWNTRALSQTLPAPGEVPEGMKPWAGSDAAPVDWDGGPVILRNGSTMFPSNVSLAYHANGTNRWDHDRKNRNPAWDIIAYSAALTPDATQTREAELVAALTEARLGFLALSGELDDETQLAWSKKHVAKIDAALSPQTLPAPPLSTDVQSAATGFHDQDDSLKVALPAPGEVERAAVVAYIRRQSDRGADIGNEKPKGSTARAAFGGGSLALKRVADNIEAGEHILNDNAALATVAAANDEAFARGVEAAAKVCDEQRDFADANLKVQHRPAHYAGVRSAAIEGAIRIRRLLSQGGGKAERYRHVKRGTVYEVIGRAQLQIATGDVCEGSELVIYRGDDGKLWARESGEFNDGRFEPLATSRSQHEGASS